MHGTQEKSTGSGWITVHRTHTDKTAAIALYHTFKENGSVLQQFSGDHAWHA